MGGFLVCFVRVVSRGGTSAGVRGVHPGDAPSQVLRGVGVCVGAVVQAFWTVIVQEASPTCSKFVTG